MMPGMMPGVMPDAKPKIIMPRPRYLTHFTLGNRIH
jgi:hypothetical protein